MISNMSKIFLLLPALSVLAIAADGKIFLASENGKASVIKPGHDWEVLATNNLNESIYASPVAENGRLYIRTSGGLYCFSGAINKP